MKNLFLIIILSIFGLYSCGSANHFNNNSIQKRKYRKGWGFNKINTNQLCSSKAEQGDTKLVQNKQGNSGHKLINDEREIVSYAKLGIEQTVEFNQNITPLFQKEKTIPFVENTNETKSILPIIPINNDTPKLSFPNSDSKEVEHPKGARVNGAAKIFLITTLIGFIGFGGFMGAAIVIGFMGGWLIIPAVVGFLCLIGLLIIWTRNLYRRENGALNKKKLEKLANK